MSASRKDEVDLQRNFMYLFERMSEPLGFGMKGSGESIVYYNVPRTEATADATISQEMMNQVSKTIDVKMPSKMPMEELRKISKLCPKSGLFGYFIPNHRKALIDLRNIFMDQSSTKDLFDMACFCRDSQMIHPHLYINALTSCLANRDDTKKFSMPAFYEIMPDIFFSDHVMKQAEKMSRMSDNCKNRIAIDRSTTGKNDAESRMWYFREDIGVNSHHFHWHVVFPGDYGRRNEMKRNRRGELFYYMHHSMVARYDAERLCNGLNRTKLFDFDNLVIEEGYFGKLYSTTAGRHWGTRQANTKLVNLSGISDEQVFFDDLKVEDLKRWRDRILEAIDTGIIIRKKEDGDKREKLNEETGIDILGDIIENSQDSPHLQYYGVDGFHNMGHLLLAFAHDPNGKYQEFFGPMGDTSTAMRDPAFYRWHKYLDDMFDKYKKTLPAYQLKEGTWPLQWEGIIVDSMKVINTNTKYEENKLSTHWTQSDIDLARGLDFYRTTAKNGGPVYASFTHLNYDPFKYEIQVTNNTGKSLDATIRIFMAPRLDEHGNLFRMAVQRLLFFELDKFSEKLKAGKNVLRRSSLKSSVTIQMDASFEILEKLNMDKLRDDFRTEEDQSRCGCGWPQHLLLPRGTPAGAEYDFFVIITDYNKDAVLSRSGPAMAKPDCRNALSFCGIVNEKYPDARPMGYPFDRKPYNYPNQSVPTEVRTIEEYVQFIPNAFTTKVVIVHEPNVVNRKHKKNGMGMVNENGEIIEKAQCASNAQPTNGTKQMDNKGKDIKFPESVKFMDNRGNRVLQIPPNRGPPNMWQVPQGTKQWQGPRSHNNREGRDNQMEGDWDYLDSDD